MVKRFHSSVAGPGTTWLSRSVRRRGVAALLAMLFMVLFSALALGFYASVTMSAQIAGNEKRGVEAMNTTESAVAFLRYFLSKLDVPDTIPADSQFEEAYMQLSGLLDGTDNLNGGSIGYPEPGVMLIPEQGYIKLDRDGPNQEGRQRFKIRIEQAGDAMVATFSGTVDHATATRYVQVRFGRAQNASSIFNFGVAAKGRVSTSGNSRIIGATDPTKGSVLSTSLNPNPVDIQGKEVSGDISVTNPDASVTFKAGTLIGGTASAAAINDEHIHKGVPAPEFPEIDTSVYTQYAKNLYVPGLPTYTNIYIPPNTNPSLNNCTIRGVMYVDVPNKVSISGAVTFQCVIVGPSAPVTNVTTNYISILGSATCLPVNGLPANYDLVNDPQANMKKLGGAFMITPGFATLLGGNMGTVGGSIITSKFSMIGTASGTIKGSIIVQDDQPTAIGGTAAITIASTGTTEYPPGVTFGHYYVPLPGSYLEMSSEKVKAMNGGLQVLVGPTVVQPPPTPTLP